MTPIYTESVSQTRFLLPKVPNHIEFIPGYFDPNKIELRLVFKNSEKRRSPSRIYNLQLSILDLEEEKGFFTRAIWYNESQVEEEANEEVEEKTPKNEAKIQVVAVLAQPYKTLN
uniref:Uncharacterized protein n=1 Tax=Populus alba TaxID=43335 RepID=A0A4U5PWD4_POPAL|nr:hypothetical protein D5086_0000168910 [Populus alba]